MVQVRRALLVSSILSAGSTRRAPYSSTLHREAPADLDQVIGDHAESNPAFHAVESSVAATTQSMAALEHADAPLASGPPSLAGAAFAISGAPRCACSGWESPLASRPWPESFSRPAENKTPRRQPPGTVRARTVADVLLPRGPATRNPLGVPRTLRSA